ncbi:MAG: hypothetical protein HKN25_15305, partial [Pyrinomonadaceae bacterium]|nr:hypothetical protein [Pyrinomonadaceae bacterium]
MFGKGTSKGTSNRTRKNNDKETEEKDEQFIENGFGIKRLFGRVSKAKEKLEDKVGSYSIDLVDSDVVTAEDTSDDIHESGKPEGDIHIEAGPTESNGTKENYEMTESHDFDDSDNNETNEVDETEFQEESGENGNGIHEHYEHSHAGPMPEPVNEFEHSAREDQPETGETHSPEEHIEETSLVENFENPTKESFEAEPDSPYLQVDEVANAG